MKTKPRQLTAAEWFHIRTLRSQAIAGFAAHRTHSVPIKKSDPTYVRAVGKTYHWCWGAQPDKQTIAKIARRCPIKAAQAFLKLYEKGDHKQYTKPRLLRDPSGRPG